MQLLLPLPGEQWGSGHAQQLGDMKMDLSLEPSASLQSCPRAPDGQWLLSHRRQHTLLSLRVSLLLSNDIPLFFLFLIESIVKL